MTTPQTIADYLQQLRAALKGADPAMIQDALFDAEEHLRSELAEHPEESEAAMLARVAGSYGAPEEVAEIYRDTEVKVQRALRAPRPRAGRGPLARFFGVIGDARSYAALFYMLLALATGIFYFTWVVAGLSLSAGLAVLIIGIPFIILFFASTRLLALVEGRLVEVMLGVRMPRRPASAVRELPLLRRIGAMFTDPRTWGTLFYMLLMLPLGIIYFTVVVTGMTLSLVLVVAPVAQLFGFAPTTVNDVAYFWPLWTLPFSMLGGVLLFFVMLHLARGVGWMHGHVAKHLLVTTAGY
ncbi:sensor domain-containing protein [Metallibacterium scheffleri]|uniref:sensor domain-containing protein n=1 Tax=Metallibacterium scheffleri TaxID=993689 RepID=UPI0023EFBB7E|nr:sensor domain-containing protein [Metallibacterium scheffleri]